jgi:hypothetical protein
MTGNRACPDAATSLSMEPTPNCSGTIRIHPEMIAANTLFYLAFLSSHLFFVSFPACNFSVTTEKCIDAPRLFYSSTDEQPKFFSK